MKKIISSEEKNALLGMFLIKYISTYKRFAKAEYDEVYYLMRNILEVDNIHDIETKKEVLELISGIPDNMEMITKRVIYSVEKLTNELKEKEYDLTRPLPKGKIFSASTAGVYIAEKLGKKQPYSRAMINNWINEYKKTDGERGLRAFRPTEKKTEIHQSDIDDFISRNESFFRV